MIDETLFEAEEKMERAIEFAKEEFAVIRTGRASAAMFSKIVIDYYDTMTPIAWGNVVSPDWNAVNPRSCCRYSGIRKITPMKLP